jgi:hypothetical protein
LIDWIWILDISLHRTRYKCKLQKKKLVHTFLKGELLWAFILDYGGKITFYWCNTELFWKMNLKVCQKLLHSFFLGGGQTFKGLNWQQIESIKPIHTYITNCSFLIIIFIVINTRNKKRKESRIYIRTVDVVIVLAPSKIQNSNTVMIFSWRKKMRFRWKTFFGYVYIFIYIKRFKSVCKKLVNRFLHMYIPVN